MGAYIKIDDEARYYKPMLIVDAETDRADEIAVGSNGGSKGYIVSSGAQDAPMYLSVTNKNLIGVSPGFAILLGKFSNIWAGAGSVILNIADASNRVLFQDFLTDKPLSNYEYSLEIAVVDKGGHIVSKQLEVMSSIPDVSLGKYRHTFGVDTDKLVFGTDEASTKLTDLSEVSIYLRGYFYVSDAEFIEYIGGGVEFDGSGGEISIQLRAQVIESAVTWGIVSQGWAQVGTTTGSITPEVDYMPKSQKVTVTVGAYSDSSVIVRALNIAVIRMADMVVTDYIPITQRTSLGGALSFSMNTIRLKSYGERGVTFKLFGRPGYRWNITYLPDFVTSSADFGYFNNEGVSTIILTLKENNSGVARADIIKVVDALYDTEYQIPIVQWGVESFRAIEDIAPGQKKTISAYAATVAKNSFNMSVGYYNAPSFSVYLRQIGFDISNYAAGENGIGTLNMKSGPCAGRDFNITKCEYYAPDDRWKLTLDRLEDSSVGMCFPNLSSPINSGDRFVLTDILMPEIYIIAASKRLLAKARVYYEQHSKLRYLYDLEIDSGWIYEQSNVFLRPGMYMQIFDSDLIGPESAYVLIDTVTITENESNIPTFKITLREKLYLPE